MMKMPSGLGRNERCLSERGRDGGQFARQLQQRHDSQSKDDVTTTMKPKKTKVVVKRRKVIKKRKRKKTTTTINSAKQTYSVFVVVALGLSAACLYQQIRLLQQTETFAVDLSWKADFDVSQYILDSIHIPRVFGNFTKERNLPVPDPLLTVCPDCEAAMAFENFQCKRRIVPWLKQNLSREALVAGQLAVSRDFPSCHACHPSLCNVSMEVQLRFDEAAPPAYRAITHELPSIPPKHKIPEQMLHLLSTYFKDWDVNKPEVFFTYNPSVVRIPPGSEIQLPGAAYLATYRISPWHLCGFSTYDFQRRKLDLLGIALLDRNLTMIPDTSAVHDLNSHPDVGRTKSTFQSFKLSEFNNTFWLTDNDLVAQIRVRTRTVGGGKTTLLRYLLGQTGIVNQERQKPKAKSIVPHMFGNGLLELSLPSGVHNLNVNEGIHSFFQDASGDTHLEILPYKPRHTARFNADKSKIKSGVHVSKTTVKDSFLTDESLLRRQYQLGLEQGGACCVRLKRDYYADLTTNATILHSRDLRLGIGTRRTKRQVDLPGQNSTAKTFLYLSRLYAFLPTPPFDVVATSGMFCFGLPSKDEMDQHVLARVTSELNPLVIGTDRYRCPAIHSATGITDKADDPDRVIVSYGVNDCVPRMVELDKRDLAHHLFSPLSDLSFMSDQDRYGTTNVN